VSSVARSGVISAMAFSSFTQTFTFNFLLKLY